MVGHARSTIDLLPGKISKDFPVGESPHCNDTLINLFTKARGHFLTQVFEHQDGSIHSSSEHDGPEWPNSYWELLKGI